MDQDRNDRTNAVGLYHYARSYHDSARALLAAKVTTTHPDAPVSYLYFHAIELFLKAFLRAHGHTVEELERKFRHDIGKMRDRATDLSLHFFMDEDRVVLAYMVKTKVVLKSRYIETGYFERPTNEALERTAKSLRNTVCAAVRELTGVNVRP